MANPQQQKGNPLFGQDYMQKYCPTEWDSLMSKSDAYRETAQRIGRETGQDVSRELGPTGMGPIVAIGIAMAKAEEIGGTEAEDIKKLLADLQKKVAKQREKEAAEGGKKSDKPALSLRPATRWSYEKEPEELTVHSWEGWMAGFIGERRKRRQEVLNHIQTHGLPGGETWAEFEARLKNPGVTARELGQIVETVWALLHP